jgi:hypothetical protein
MSTEERIEAQSTFSKVILYETVISGFIYGCGHSTGWLARGYASFGTQHRNDNPDCSQRTIDHSFQRGAGHPCRRGCAARLSARTTRGLGPASFGNSQFQASDQFKNLVSLPFTAAFNSATMVPGQNVTVTTQATANMSGPVYYPLTTTMLRPQTINGTISAVSSEGGFTTYTVTLAPYDLFPQFAVQPGQTTLLTAPNTVVVYADSNTQMLNQSSAAAGSIFRFYGLVFNDNGTLRMDCAQINDGVTE